MTRGCAATRAKLADLAGCRFVDARQREAPCALEQRTAVDRNQWIRMHAIAGDALDGRHWKGSPDMGPPAAVRRRRSASLLWKTNSSVRQLGCCHVSIKQSCRSTRSSGPRNILQQSRIVPTSVLATVCPLTEALDAKDENVARIASVKKPCDMAMTNKSSMEPVRHRHGRRAALLDKSFAGIGAVHLGGVEERDPSFIRGANYSEMPGFCRGRSCSRR